MKKLLFLLLSIPALLSAQDWSTYGSAPYRGVRNAEPFLGQGAGTIESPLQWDVAVSQPDTSLWQFVSSGSDGKLRLMKNRDTFLGKAAGTVYIQLVYGVTDSVLATQNWVKNQNPFTGRKQTFDTVNATVKYLLNGNDINSSGTLTNAAYQNGRPVFIDLVSFTDSVAMQTGYFVPKNTAGIRYNKSLTLTDTLYSTYISTGNYIAANGRQSNLTLDNAGALNFSLRLQVTSAADGVMNVANWSTNGWSKFELGVGANATGFIRGVSDTDITGIYLHSANGSLWFLTISDAGTISVSSTAP